MRRKIFLFTFLVLASFLLFSKKVKAELLTGHCDCSTDLGCVDKKYDTTTPDGMKAGEDFCISEACKSLTVLQKGACPAKPTPATPDKKDPSMVKLENPLDLSTDVKVIIGTIIKGLLGIMGALSLLMVVKGATTWLMAAGSAEKVSAGSKTMLWAVLGAVLTVASYVILSGIMKFF